MDGGLKDRILFPIRIIGFRVVEVKMQTATFFTDHRSLNDQLRRDGDVSQFQSVFSNFKVPVIFLNFFQQKLNSALRPFKTFGGSNNADIIPHQSADFVPVV